MPSVTALTSEYSPKSKRSLMVGLMFSGYSIGGMLAALSGIYLIPGRGVAIYILYCRFATHCFAMDVKPPARVGGIFSENRTA
ncbi:hypothetical protein ABMB44_12735 [Levilactobacillus brevis]